MCSTFYGGLFPEPGRVAYNAGLNKGCFYKVRQYQLCASDSQPVSTFLLLTIQTRVLSSVQIVVVVSLITNADMVMFTRRDAMRKKRV